MSNAERRRIPSGTDGQDCRKPCCSSSCLEQATSTTIRCGNDDRQLTLIAVRTIDDSSGNENTFIAAHAASVGERQSRHDDAVFARTAASNSRAPSDLLSMPPQSIACDHCHYCRNSGCHGTRNSKNIADIIPADCDIRCQRRKLQAVKSQRCS